MSKVKYFGSYHGPSYGSNGWSEDWDAFASLKGAMEAMWRRQEQGADDVLTYKENPHGVLVYWNEEYVRFPATTREDCIDLYYAIPEDGGYFQGDLAYRISVGPRGGVRVEKA